ncbi:alpha/beta hydrolase [Streptomyces sp. NPDC051940]|uniref:alpha/beta hydrolase n=1 Tax=Streptomyces sp. NPDC051940 TaxID=3155675 RepID=UPI003437B234
MPISRSVRLLGPAVALALFAAGCTDDSPGPDSAPDDSRPSASGAAPSSLDWKRCGRPTPEQGGGDAPGRLADGTRWECATLKVPLDYGEPGGKQIGIALIRARAKDSGRRIGSLVYNFGGPGGSGVALLPQLAEEYEKLRGRYDLVSFDPRGVGASAPVHCLDDEETDDYRTVDGTPDDAAEEREALAASREQADACEKNSGDLLPYLTTAATARDMDRIRAALGDDKLHYFGISYGTELGGVYAHLFPKRVGRAVFDAVVDPTQDAVASSLAQAKGFELALTDYMADCAEEEGDDCPTGPGGAEGRRRILALLDRVDSDPLPASGGRRLTEGDAVTGIVAALYSKESWPYLTEGLQEAGRGQGRILLALADFYMERSDDGDYSNQGPANLAVNCADSAERFTAAQARRQAAAFAGEAPVFGGLLGWSLLACTDWPVEGDSAHLRVDAPGAPPILVVGNTGDPATPYEGAARMARELGVGVRLTYHGEGHGAYGQSDCVDGTVEDYLLQGKVPRDGKECR